MKNKMVSLLVSSCMLASLCILPAGAIDAPTEEEMPSAVVNIDLPNEQSEEDLFPDNAGVMSTAWGSDYDTATEFTISSKEDLLAFAEMVNEGKNFADKTVTLANDLDLSENNWKPIGANSSSKEERRVFAGTFDGGNHIISNLKIEFRTDETSSSPAYIRAGLFGTLSGTVKNVELRNFSIKASSNYMGGIAGEVQAGGKIENCLVSGTITSVIYQSRAQGKQLGGIAGISAGTIQSCTSNCTITGATQYAGGIAGKSDGENSSIILCTSNTNISTDTTEQYIGGIIGELNDGTISDCVNTGSLGGYAYTGGIVGASNDSTISNCSNSGAITGKKWEDYPNENRRIGGIVGEAQAVQIEACENTGTITASDVHEVGGIAGQLYYGSSIKDCSNNGAVTGGDETGGIVGYALAYYTGGYNVSSCTNNGSVTGSSGVGGIVGVGTANNNDQSEQIISGCSNSGDISGTGNIGGIVGEHNSNTGFTGSGTNAATVSGCINTGSVPSGGGAIVGNNNDAVSSGSGLPGKVENNFWPAELGEYAVGSGAGSSGSESSEAVKNNSSYQPDGTLTTPIPDTDSEGTIDNLGEAIDKVIGSGDESNVPDVLKVTVTYHNGGHGTAPASETVTKGSKVTLPSMSNDGYYTFIGWENGGASYTAGQEVPVMEDMTFTAQWRNDTPSTGGGGGSSDPTYSISLPSKVTGGEVSIQKRYAEKGETVTITVTPDDGYELDELIVTDSKGNELDLTDKGNGKFTFKMPAGRVEIEVSFQEIVIEPVNPFVDVSTSDYYYDAVLWAVENGVTNGTSATTFGPNMAVSRAQMVTFLWRAHGSPKATGTNPFTDVSTSDYYYDAVLWAVANGVTNGTSATIFSPDTAVTRSQAVTFQWRAAGSPVVSGSSFGDVATDAYYVNAVTWAVANGITNGTGGNTFSPDVVVSRAQAVTFLYREQE